MRPLAAVPDLDHELAALYNLPLEAFTKARNDLASRLKKAHQADVAAEVRALKKPSAVAWAANSLVSTDRKLVGELLSAGERLRETQQQALHGKAGADEIAEASGAERDAVRALLAAARKRLGARATPALLDRLGQTLRAAARAPTSAAIDPPPGAGSCAAIASSRSSIRRTSTSPGSSHIPGPRRPFEL